MKELPEPMYPTRAPKTLLMTMFMFACILDIDNVDVPYEYPINKPSPRYPVVI